jgi:hypothetical protein
LVTESNRQTYQLSTGQKGAPERFRKLSDMLDRLPILLLVECACGYISECHWRVPGETYSARAEEKVCCGIKSESSDEIVNFHCALRTRPHLVFHGCHESIAMFGKDCEVRQIVFMEEGARSMPMNSPVFAVRIEDARSCSFL